MRDPYAHPTLVVCQIVDTVRNRLAQLLVGKIVNSDFHRSAATAVFAPTILEIPHQLLLFRVDRDHGLTPTLEPLHQSVDVLKLRIAVGMRLALSRFAVGLQAKTRFIQQRRDSAMANGVALVFQRMSQHARTADRPPQRRIGLAARRRFHQGFQRGKQVRIMMLERFAATTRTANTRRARPRAVPRLRFRADFRDSSTNCRARHTGSTGHGRRAAPTQFEGLGGRPKSPSAFVQRVFQLVVLPPNPGDGCRFLHAATMAELPQLSRPNCTGYLFTSPYRPAPLESRSPRDADECSPQS